ncbi:MAG: hypothetical protein JNL58_03810 [Planctomyces sp.]|nr:hypothetical protein [Planctomyces sp.]
MQFLCNERLRIGRTQPSMQNLATLVTTKDTNHTKEWQGGLSFLTTEYAEETEESQKYPIVFFRVVRVFLGYQSRWLHIV